MENTTYELLRQFADSWGLVYIFFFFFSVTAMLFLRGAKSRAQEAANIPLDDDHPLPEVGQK